VSWVISLLHQLTRGWGQRTQCLNEQEDRLGLQDLHDFCCIQYGFTDLGEEHGPPVWRVWRELMADAGVRLRGRPGRRPFTSPWPTGIPGMAGIRALTEDSRVGLER
jgi:hypothetical protein